MIDYKIIGERLKKARLSKGLTQEVLSNRLGVSIAFLSRIERGSSHISLKRLSQICDILDVSEGNILNGTSNNSKSYLSSDFEELLTQCTDIKKKMIYEVAKTIINN